MLKTIENNMVLSIFMLFLARSSGIMISIIYKKKG